MRGPSKTDTLQARLWRRLSANPGGAISGNIIAMSVIAAADHYAAAGTTLTLTVTTLLVFWLAHVYSEVLAQRLRSKYGVTDIVATMAQQLPMLEAPALSVLFLLLAVVGLLNQGVAVGLALANGVSQMFMWGILTGRRLRWSWPRALFAGTVDGLLGLVIVGLKVLLQH